MSLFCEECHFLRIHIELNSLINWHGIAIDKCNKDGPNGFSNNSYSFDRNHSQWSQRIQYPDEQRPRGNEKQKEPKMITVPASKVMTVLDKLIEENRALLDKATEAYDANIDARQDSEIAIKIAKIQATIYAYKNLKTILDGEG